MWTALDTALKIDEVFQLRKFCYVSMCLALRKKSSLREIYELHDDVIVLYTIIIKENDALLSLIKCLIAPNWYFIWRLKRSSPIICGVGNF